MQHIDGWLDLCSGVGAGFPYAGIKLWERQPNQFCEKDSYCRNILKLRYPSSNGIFADVNYLDDDDDAKPDLITASPPCQPFSVDGKRLAATDDRNCIPAVLTAIRNYKPKFAVIENVVGLLNCPYSPGDKPGSYFGYVLDSLSASGYDAEWICIGSDEFAAPWRRQRLLVIAIARCLEFDWSEVTSWQNQIRTSIAGIEPDFSTRSRGPGIPRKWLSTPDRIHELAGESNSAGTSSSSTPGVATPGVAKVDRPQIGVASRDGDNRDRREALGNALDWRVAAVALKRVEYLSDLAAKHWSAY
ncbi:DNA cytosine methyltransferase [Microcoleus anatoxicus]|uniref:DNA cytosine methyltransferase n=1 Tax=Microcoleus anatoxicus TaxID=2705319 RepID=UPI003BF59E24